MELKKLSKGAYPFCKDLFLTNTISNKNFSNDLLRDDLKSQRRKENVTFEYTSLTMLTNLQKYS